MTQTVGAFILERLHQHGVHTIFGYPGDGINGIAGGFHEHGDKVDFVQCRHEEIAAFAATAYAKFSGDLGVCLATSGPGAIHLLNGVYDAKLDKQPLLVIVGQQSRQSIGASYQQEVDLTNLFKDACHEYVQYCTVPGQARHLIDRAVRTARGTRSPVCLVFPNDVQESEYADPPRTHGSVFSSGAGAAKPTITPPAEELRRAAEVLNSGSKVAILIGQGAAEARQEVVEVAELLGAGVSKALNGRDAVSDQHPWMAGAIGLLGTKPSHTLMDECDTLLMIGTSFPYSEWLPEQGQARAVEIDIDAGMIGIRYPTEVNLIGDSRDTLRELIPLLERKEDRAWQEKICAEVDRWWRIQEDVAMLDAKPLNPQRVYYELNRRLPDDVVLTADSGSATNWWARQLRLRDGMRAALSGTLATMAPGVPYALAAKFVFPDRPVIASLGDGAFQMLGVNTLIDIARYQHRWPNKQLVIVVLNNGDLNQVTWEQRVMSGDPKVEVTQELPDFPYARYAELLGLKGIRVDAPDDVGPAWDEALAHDGPVLFEAVTDPEVPPLPPHINMDQATSMAKSLMGGDPHALRIMVQSAKGKLQEFIER